MGCTKSKYTNPRVTMATNGVPVHRPRSQSLRKIPTRIFALLRNGSTAALRNRRQESSERLPNASSTALNLLALPPTTMVDAGSSQGSVGYAARLEEAASQEDCLAQLDAARDRTRNEYEDFGSPTQWTVEAFDRLDFDDNPMDEGGRCSAAFY